jgi:hypothetical protein
MRSRISHLGTRGGGGEAEGIFFSGADDLVGEGDSFPTPLPGARVGERFLTPFSLVREGGSSLMPLPEARVGERFLTPFSASSMLPPQQWRSTAGSRVRVSSGSNEGLV